MWSKKMVFCAFAMALMLPLSAVGSDLALETVEEPTPVQPTNGTTCDPALVGEGNKAKAEFGEPLKGEQLIVPWDSNAILGLKSENGRSRGCQYETCDFSQSCWDGCVAQWCGGEEWPCPDEDGQQSFCWCVRSCSDICI